MTASRYSPDELAQFRSVQRLAYDCATEIAAGLEPGITEREAAAQLGELLRSRGVRSYFHQPFAWFGDRTCFRGFRKPTDFFPSRRKLEKNDPAILDVAPIVDGYAADIGYAFCLGENPTLDTALADLEAFRELVVQRVNAGDTLGEVYRQVEDLLADLGYRNCHRKYPFGVLAHRVYRQPRLRAAGLPFLGFGLSASLGLLGQAVASRLPKLGRLGLLGQASPFCNTGPGSDERPEAGLWAFEPHIGSGDVGAKWEELLVVDDDRAYWLDDDLPHVRRWAQVRATG